MREIKFRGKDFDTKEWKFGYYGKHTEYGDNGGVECYYRETATELHYIIDANTAKSSLVIGETVGQYTGLKDKNSVEIYEDDVMAGGNLQVTGGVNIVNDKCTVTFKSGMFKLGAISLCSYASKAEVIGNIHETELSDK